MSVRCRLVRPDGSKWQVRELQEADEGFRVDAVPKGAADGDPASGGGPATLEDELLSRGDHVEWVEEGGEVLWAMRVPMDAVGESPDTAEAAGARGAA